jgi:hypothetical protein
MRLPVEIDLHRAVGGRGDLEPVLANIQLGTAMATFSGFAPGAKNGRNLNDLASPHELARESGLPDRHTRGVTCGNHRSDNFTDESLNHDHCLVSLTNKPRSRRSLSLINRWLMMKDDPMKTGDAIMLHRHIQENITLPFQDPVCGCKILFATDLDNLLRHLFRR